MMQTNFDEYYKEVLIIKPDGQKIETKAWVQSKLILLQDISVPIQIGDYLERTRINGITDRYVITAVDVYEDSPLQHIEAKYQNVGCLQKEEKKSVKINGDIYADRVYIDSIDNSRNVANSVDPRFEELKKAVSSQPNAEEIIRLIDNLMSSKDKKTFTEKLGDFLSITSSCIDVVKPFLPWLTSLFD